MLLKQVLAQYNLLDKPLKFTVSRKAKNMRISVNMAGTITFTIPYGTPETAIVSMIKDKHQWIYDALEKMQDRKANSNTHRFYTEDTPFSTRFHRLQITALPKAVNTTLRISNGVIQVQYPTSENITNPHLQDFIKKGITEALRIEAKHFLPRRLAQLAIQHRFTYSGVVVKDLKTRWGSCSHTNNINLNLHLMRLTDELIDYVLVHELVHTVVKNHSNDFWSLLVQKMPNALQLDHQLKNYHPYL